ncbi:MAG: SGNH/GDSL hydrolase family protein [Elainellaceae cyanobacterium]
MKLLKTARNHWQWVLVAVIFFAAFGEIALRLGFGFGYPVLSQTDSETGYRFRPNQDLKRFGRRILYNQYSQRSEPITEAKQQGTLRLMMVGDSVLNGGSLTSHEHTISEVLEEHFTDSNYSSEVLNASAGSWGIGNQLGYVKKFGTFNSDAIILQIGTHDLYQPMSTSEVVGTHPGYPDVRPLLATQEVISRYLLPRMARLLPTESSPQTLNTSALDAKFTKNMEYLRELISQVDNNTPILVLFTPNREDLIPQTTTPEYKQEFISILEELNIPIIDTQAAWSDLPTSVVESYFHDGVHLSIEGNKAVAELIDQSLCIDSDSLIVELCTPNN